MRVDLCMKNRGNLNHRATVPRCPGHVLMAEKRNVSTNAVACNGKAVAITYSRVNEQHLEVPFVLVFFESLFFIWCRYPKHT